MSKQKPRFLLSGGITRPFGSLLGPGHGSKCAQLGIIDWDAASFKSLFKYETPREYCTDILPSIYFTACSLVGDELYLCTTTEVMKYKWPSMELLLRIDHPYFNDVHHVALINRYIYVADTGLDAVLKFNLNGEYRSIQHVLDRDPFAERNDSQDYRKLASTKPHQSHPNFVFELQGEVWVTRFEQRDAVNLSNHKDKISILTERPHDGHVRGERIYFTTVNGHIIIADVNSRKIIEDIDVNSIDGRGRPLGWCRGLEIVDKYAYVAFSKLRSTKIEENVRWARSMLIRGKAFDEALPARVCCIDLEKRVMVGEVVIPENEMSAIFSVISV